MSSCPISRREWALQVTPSFIIARAHRDLCADPHRSGGRHHRHLAALSLPSRRPDDQRRHQHPRPGADRVADRHPDRAPLARHRRDGRGRRHGGAAATSRGCGCCRCSPTSSRSRGLTLTTTSESPAGAGLAGSSALNVAVCAALAEWKREHYEPEALLQMAHERRGPDDQRAHRPAGLPAGALRRPRRARARRRRHPPRAARRRSCASSSAASCSATPASRGTRAPTTGRSPRSTSTATATCSTASSASATPPRRCARRSVARRLGRDRPAIAEEWENRKRLAPGVTTPAIDDLIARARGRGCHRRQGLRRRRRRLPVLLRPAGGQRRHPRGARRRRRPAARLHLRAPRADAWITASIAQVLGEIADLLEIKGENAFKIRAYRSAADTIATWRRRRRADDRRPAARDAGHRQGPRGADPRARRHRRLRLSPGAARRSFRRPCSTCCACRAWGRRRWPCCTRRWASAASTTSAAAARDGRLRRMKGMGAKKEAQILKAIEERAARRGPPPARRHDGRCRRAAGAPARRRRPPSSSSRSAACAAAARPAATSTSLQSAATRGGDGRLRRPPAGRAVLGQGDTKSSVRLQGGYQADLRLVPAGEPRRRHAVLHRLEGPQHRAARPRAAARD